MRRSGHLVGVLRSPALRRLLTARLAGQFGDGVFQASLAGAVLFNPERQAHAADVAAGFAVLLLPYSFVGPFAGVLLDRWWRQRVLVAANALRALGVLGVAAEIAGRIDGIPFYVSALVIVSLSRFVLSALSAAFPHVVEELGLVTANAFTATAGTVATVLGGVAAIGVRAGIGSSDNRYAVLAAAALVPYAIAALVARGFDHHALGPSEQERGRRHTARQVVHGLASGARYLRARGPVADALLTTAGHRLCYGIWTVCTLLLYRNWFPDGDVLRNGLPGLGQVIGAVAVGGVAAALCTPTAYRRIRPHRWIGATLVASAVVDVALGLPFDKLATVVGAALLGFTSQSMKISVDTVVQESVADDFRGRVFALYDMVFNLALVTAAAITAIALPENGHSVGAVIAIGAGWLLLGFGYVSRSRRATS